METGTIDIVPMVKHLALLVILVLSSSWLASRITRAALSNPGGKAIRGSRGNAETLITVGTAALSAYLGYRFLF